MTSSWKARRKRWHISKSYKSVVWAKSARRSAKMPRDALCWNTLFAWSKVHPIFCGKCFFHERLPFWWMNWWNFSQRSMMRIYVYSSRWRSRRPSSISGNQLQVIVFQATKDTFGRASVISDSGRVPCLVNLSRGPLVVGIALRPPKTSMRLDLNT